MIPYGRQDIDASDLAAIDAVLRSDWLTQGPAVPRFEEAMAAWCGAQYAVAVCNATAALHLACRALDVGPHSRVWTSPNTFVASANCARYVGATVDFVDINPATFNLSLPALATKLAAAERNGTLPDVLIPVHFAGLPCDMAEVGELAKRYGFRVIEDASHAVGAEYQGRRIGSSGHADITVFSFHPVKILTTAEGGIALTDSPELAARLALLRSHGITRDPTLMREEADGPWYYEQLELGYNYRMTDMQAALGYSQLQRLEAFLARRRALVARYDAAGFPCGRQQRPTDRASAHHLYPIQVPAPLRRKVFEQLRAAHIGVNVHYIPVHCHPYYRELGFRSGDFPQAERYYAQAISLPLYYGLEEAQQDYVCRQLSQILEDLVEG